MKISLLTLVLLLSACGGGAVATSAQTPQEQLAGLEASGALPKLDRSADLAGPDLDGNGIRDDVDTFIAASYSVPAQRMAAAQLAGVLLAEILVDKKDMVAVRAISKRTGKAIKCITGTFDKDDNFIKSYNVVSDIESITTNTKARLLNYLAFSKALDGSSLILPTGDTCEK